MAATSTTETWDEAWTLTMRAKRKRLTDNISDSYPTIDRFRKTGIMETENGGKQIQEDLMYSLLQLALLGYSHHHLHDGREGVT